MGRHSARAERTGLGQGHACGVECMLDSSLGGGGPPWRAHTHTHTWIVADGGGGIVAEALALHRSAVVLGAVIAGVDG